MNDEYRRGWSMTVQNIEGDYFAVVWLKVWVVRARVVYKDELRVRSSSL